MKKRYRQFAFLSLCLVLILSGCGFLPFQARDEYGDKGLVVDEAIKEAFKMKETEKPSPRPMPTATQAARPVNTPEPTPEPTPAPTPEPTPEIHHHDALFIGDSNTVLFMKHVFREREKDPNYMEDAIFLAKTGLGLRHIEEESFTKCDGTEWMVYDLLKSHSFNKIYIMLGTNDIGYYKDINRTIFNYKRLLNNITAMAEADIYIQSILPLGKKLKNHKYLNNDRADQVNREIAKYGERLGCYYLDIASCFRDTNGDLDKKYSEDGLHLDRNAMPLWADYIMENTRH